MGFKLFCHRTFFERSGSGVLGQKEGDQRGFKAHLIRFAIACSLSLFWSVLLVSPGWAAEKFCSDAPYFGVIDGEQHPVPTQITIDRDCTFQNFPASNPLTSTLNFQTNDPSIYLIIFNNVIFTGHMACANVDHRIWFANGSDYGSSNSCQDLFIPVESIIKESPATTASIGVPFTYTLTMPSMTLVGGPSPNDLHSVKLWDNLEDTGVDLEFVDIKAYFKDDPSRTITLVPEDDPTASGGVWSETNLSYKPITEIIRGGNSSLGGGLGEQIVVEITVVLKDTPNNTIGKSFTNTAKWSFGRLIDDVFYEPLPGEWGVSTSMTIAGPELVVTKTSNETALNLGVPATFTIDVQNVGGTEAWNSTIVDEIPEGMCNYDPTTGLSARIVTAAGSTVSSLTPNVDYTATFDNPVAPGCSLTLELLTAQANILPNHRLLLTYQSQLDTTVSTEGLNLTNVAGATSWFSADPNGSFAYQAITRTLTDGTPGIIDHQDSQTVITALSGYYFQKTVTNLDTGAEPAITAYSGDTLRYRVRLFNVDQTIDAITLVDPIDLNFFDPGSFSMVSLPANTAFSFNSTSGVLTVTGLSGTPLNVAPGEEVFVEFDVTLRPGIANGTQVANQASLSATGINVTDSDDPFVNGISSPTNGPPPDPTTVEIQSPGALTKEFKDTNKTSATIGETFTYTITVPAAAVDVPLYDVKIRDDLQASNADLVFVGANVATGSGSWILSNSGTPTNPIIEDVITGIDIPAGNQAVIEITVRLQNTGTNQGGLVFTNTADYTYNRVNGNESSRLTGGAAVSPSMIVVEPAILSTKTVTYDSPAGKPATEPAMVGDILEYQVVLNNTGNATAYDISITDLLPSNVSLIAGSASAQLNGTAVAGFVVAPDQLPDGSYAWGQLNGDGSLDIPSGQSLVISYQLSVDSLSGSDISNSAYSQWSSLDGASGFERNGSGCPLVTAPNSYCIGPATATVSTLDNTFITKTVADDSFAESPPSTGNAIVRVGDTITYDLSLNLREYTTRNVAVEDQLPSGMVFESFTINANANFSYTLAGSPAAGASGLLRWEFGNILNQPSNDGTPLDPLIIRYTARVISDAPPQGLNTAPGNILNNQAALSYASGDPALFPDRLTASAPVNVNQPLMNVITKVDRGVNRSGSGTPADPYQINIATDEMNFEVSSCNTGLAPAYGVVISDQLAPQFDETDLLTNPPVLTIGSTRLNPGVDYLFTAPAVRGGEMRFVLSGSAAVNAGQCVTINYDIGFHRDLTTSSTWSNQARLHEYRSIPTSLPGRVYAANDLAELWMTNLVNEEQLLKTLQSSDEATIGDEVVYQITVPALPMNLALTDVQVSDSLPEVLEYVSATAINSNGIAVPLSDNSPSPAQVELAITDIPAGQQVIITLTTRVLNNEQANAGTSFTNTASYTSADISPGLDTSSTSGPVTIVEPLVNISTAVTNVTNPGIPPNIGDVLRFSVTINADGGAAGDEYSDPFDIGVFDSLSLGLAYRAGSSLVDGAGNVISDPIVTGDGISTAQTLTWTLADGNADIDLVEGSPVVISYDVLVLDQVQAGQLLSNAVYAEWTGLDGNSGFERNGTETPPVNDYVTTVETLSLRAELAMVLIKSVVNTSSGENPGLNAHPGETLQYTLEISNRSIAPLNNGSLSDVLAGQFLPGSLELISISDTAADFSFIDATGGINGTGLLDIRNLTLARQDEPGDSMTIVYNATLAPVIDSGTNVLNQAQLTGDNLSQALSNTTTTQIGSAPVFEIWKTSADITDDPDLLSPGDILRYTITVRNVGDENAVLATLVDAVPVHTSYVPNSTTLNGSYVSDPVIGVSPLQDGLQIYPTGMTNAGFMPAVAASSTDPVATVTFDVIVDAAAVDGTIIANQGFLSAEGAGSGPRPVEPSDDPGTSILDDPTRDVVGNVPLVDAHKTVTIQIDNGSDNIVDPGDILRYSIVISNGGTTPATNVVLTDEVPVGTTYIEDSVTLNGLPVAQPDLGVSPLISGINVSSSDMTPPAPGDGAGMLSPNSSAVILFDVRVNDVPSGTVISNQGTVSSQELAPEPTDADGIDTNGDQPTEVVVGDAQQLALVKTVSVVGNGPAIPGALLEYVLQATNIGSLPATNVLLTDDLNALSGLASYVPGSARLEGSTSGTGYSGTTLSADYALQYGTLAPGAVAELRFQVRIEASATLGTTITNTGRVSWNNPVQSITASVSLGVGGVPGSASLNGKVWHDADLGGDEDTSERALAGWTVELYRGSQQLASVQTDSGGNYRLAGLNSAGSPYILRFVAAGAGPNTPALGWPISPFTNAPQQIDDIVVNSGDNLLGLSLPITPNGIVYDSVFRSSIPGARLTLVEATTGTPVPSRCFEDPVQQNQATPADGFYKFDMNFSDPSCPSGGTYTIQVVPPGISYEQGVSQILQTSYVIDPSNNLSTAFSVATCPGSSGDALPGTVEFCEISSSPEPPPMSVQPGATGTQYALSLVLSNGTDPFTSQAFNNHLPVDPVLDGAVSISKTSSLINVVRGQLVPYTITVSNLFGAPLYDVSLVDVFPAGFKYVKGSGVLNNMALEPNIEGRQLTWDDIDLQINDQLVFRLLLVVGSGVSEGKYTNKAQVINPVNQSGVSGVATATVQVIPDPTFDCTDVMGKVFDDHNMNGRQDEGEEGLSGIRIVTARGLTAVSDPFGRFHITCAVVPDETRGSNFILKVDDHTLPTGFRMTTENPRVQRATRGKALKFSFGATVHRVVGLDFADGVFEPDKTELRIQWHPRLKLLIEELQVAPSILRLSYLADVESEELVQARLKVIRDQIEELWDIANGGYPLTVETEVYWRRGSSPDLSGLAR